MKKVVFYLIFTVLISVSCNKSMEISKDIENTMKYETQITITESVKGEMVKILNTNDFNKIPWNETNLDFKADNEYTLSCKNDTGVVFIFHKIGSMKMYKLGNEVHAVY